MAKQLLSQITIKKHPKSCYFESDDVKKYTRKSIVPVINRGVFHNYVHVCKQLFLCDVIRSRCIRLTPLSQVSHLFILEWKRKERNDR